MLIRVVAWMRRFAFNCGRGKARHHSGMLEYDEIVHAKHLLYKLSQQDHYPYVFLAVQQSTSLPRGHMLIKFSLTLSDQGHILVCSRVRDPEAPTSPLKLTLLHPKSLLTKLLVRMLHSTYSHAGVTAMTSILAMSFLIPNLRNLLKLVSRTCAACQRAYARPLQHMMGMLPMSRTTPAPLFHRARVDFAGPFLLKVGHTCRPVSHKDLCRGVCLLDHEGGPF